MARERAITTAGAELADCSRTLDTNGVKVGRAARIGVACCYCNIVVTIGYGHLPRSRRTYHLHVNKRIQPLVGQILVAVTPHRSQVAWRVCVGRNPAIGQATATLIGCSANSITLTRIAQVPRWNGCRECLKVDLDVDASRVYGWDCHYSIKHGG